MARVADKAADLAYDANEISRSGGRVTMNLVWTGTGYAPLSARQRRDLIRGLERSDIHEPLIGPQAGVPPMQEWWVLAERQEDAPELAAWFESHGYSGGTVQATTEDAARRMVERTWMPPVPWVLTCADDNADAQASDRNFGSRLRRNLPLVLLGLGLLAGAGMTWIMGWTVLPSPDRPAQRVNQSLSIYCIELFLAAILQLAGVVAFGLIPLRVFLIIRPAAIRGEGRLSMRVELFYGALLLALGVGIGFLIVAAVRLYLLPVLIGSFIVAIMGLIGRVLDPPDRKRSRWPTAILGTLLASVVGWTALADLVLAGGLELPIGVVKADLFTRTAVLVVIVLPPAMALLVGSGVYRLVRREDRASATLLVLMTLCATLLMAVSGFAFLLSEAGGIVKHPGQGFWSLSTTTQRVSGFAAGGGKHPGILRNGELYGVIGEVGDRAVLLTHPCGDGERQVVVQPAGSLSFEPVDSQACNAVRAATVAGRPSP